jgi:glycosyltransferase involved in cell wall biosynthesis
MRDDDGRGRLRLMLVFEDSAAHRAWDEAVPALRSEGADPIAVTVFDPGTRLDQFARLGCETACLNAAGAHGYPAAAWRLARLARAHRADVVQGVESIAGTISGLARRFRTEALTVFHRQHIEHPSNRRMTVLSHAAGRLTQMTLACSEAAAEAAVAEGVPAARIRVAFNGANDLRPVPQQEVDALRGHLGIPTEAAVVSAVARLRAEKGLADLLRAMEIVAARTPRPVHVVVAGDGPEAANLRRLADTLVPGRAHFVGHQSDVAPWFRLADVVAMPSHREAFGVSAAEAMSAGRPLVAASVGGLPEVVEDDITGVLVPPRDPRLLGEALATLLNEPGRAAAMGRAARARFEASFTNLAMVRGWLRAYSDFLGQVAE